MRLWLIVTNRGIGSPSVPRIVNTLSQHDKSTLKRLANDCVLDEEILYKRRRDQVLQDVRMPLRPRRFWKNKKGSMKL
ncbi:RNA-directed DNA polymerase (Reverse transcriptase), Ribonuclease H [Gossypium australe]|uniref:RNA-directed DNA polymerase (Reverse transcriptase), Ribonuclease H n=1 Tax=Gossypium australe TaxID=47621 RepID=A0A5B6UWA0_9ROSI|nr:RNA-directed DNA polymerase (Reverse transcriptase), Ribonuclease H [Gossypium australe]